MRAPLDPVEIANRLRRPGSDTADDLVALRDRFVARIVVDFLALSELAPLHAPELESATGLTTLIDAAAVSWSAMLDVADDPNFCFWVQTWKDVSGAHADMRVAGNDIAQVIAASGIEPEKFEAVHVAQLGAFVVAAAQRTGHNVRLPHPVPVAGGMLPSSGVERDASESVVLGSCAGLVQWQDRALQRAVPTAEIPGWRLRVHAHGLACHLRHVERWDRLVEYDERLAAAANLVAGMELLDETLSGFCEHAGLITDTCVPMTTGGITPMASGSYTRLQGAIFIADNDDAELTAEMLIHEVSHTRLALLEDMAPIFSGFSRNEMRHYSPWRDTRRSAEGVLHALFVHIEIARFWCERLAVVNAPRQRDRCLRRVWTLLEQLRTGSDALWCSGDFTDVGRVLLQHIDADRVSIEARVPPLAHQAQPFFSEIKIDPSLARLSIAQAVAAHREGVLTGRWAK